MSDFIGLTWNVYSGTPVTTLAPVLAKELVRGVSLGGMQEAGDDKRNDITTWLEDKGLLTRVYRQYRTFWDPKKWTEIASWNARLSQTGYWDTEGRGPFYSMGMFSLLASLDDDWLGKTLLLGSYHTPPNTTDRREVVTLETFRTLGEMAEETHANAVLFVGDDNWDELKDPDRGHPDEVRSILLGQATGLRQLRGPQPTHGKRYIDDMRIKRGGGIRPSGEAWVTPVPAPDDHHIHSRGFNWRDAS